MIGPIETAPDNAMALANKIIDTITAQINSGKFAVDLVYAAVSKLNCISDIIFCSSLIYLTEL